MFTAAECMNKEPEIESVSVKVNIYGGNLKHTHHEFMQGGFSDNVGKITNMAT